MPKFNVKVKLVGTDGNAFALMGQVNRGLKKAGATADQVKEFMGDAMSGDYNHLLGVCCDWVDVY
jgi:hypothetical protein